MESPFTRPRDGSCDHGHFPGQALLRCCLAGLVLFAYTTNTSPLAAAVSYEEVREQALPAWRELHQALSDIDVTMEWHQTVHLPPEVAEAEGKSTRSTHLFQHYQRHVDKHIDVRAVRMDSLTDPFSTVQGWNRRYHFDVIRFAPDQPLKIQAFEPRRALLCVDPPDTQLDFFDSSKTLGYLEMAYTAGFLSLPRLFANPDIKKRPRVVANAKSPDTLIDVIVTTPAADASTKPEQTVLTLDRTRHWVLTSWTYTVPGIHQTTDLVYQTGPTGLPFPESVSQVVLYDNGKEFMQTEHKFSPPQRYVGRGQEAYLPYYGLPEPDSWNVPWWGWVLVTGVIIIAARMTWLAIRRRA